MRLTQYLKHYAYATANSYAEAFERNHLRIALFELLVTGYAVYHFAREMVEAFETQQLKLELAFMQEHWRDVMRLFWNLSTDVAETIVFSMMFLLVLSRVVINFRRSRLGYIFSKMLAPGTPSGGIPNDSEDVFMRLRAAPLLGSCNPAGDRAELSTIIHKIAVESASVFSMRARFGVDRVWATWEEVYLDEWHQMFPAAIWRTVAGQGRPLWQGYFSVIVPITQAAFYRVRRGQLPTVLAPVDPDAANYWKDPERAVHPFASGLYLLAYTQLFIGQRRDKWDPLQLLTCSIEHISALLIGFYPDPEARSRCTFSLICESANEPQNKLLENLGLEPVIRNVDEERKTRLDRIQSPAGFELFQFQVQDGQPRPRNDVLLPAGRKFVSLLLDMAQRVDISKSRPFPGMPQPIGNQVINAQP